MECTNLSCLATINFVVILDHINYSNLSPYGVITCMYMCLNNLVNVCLVLELFHVFFCFSGIGPSRS